jgi:hypothetical protein
MTKKSGPAHAVIPAIGTPDMVAHRASTTSRYKSEPGVVGGDVRNGISGDRLEFVDE